MPDYKVVHGTKVQNFASDPPAPSEGQVWYNTTTNTSKYFFVNLGAWATGNAMNTARATLGGVGTQTAALAFGGRTPPSSDSDLTETYNGTNWTEVNDLNTLRRLPEGAGTQTAALAFGGRGIPPDYPPDVLHDNTETWNGTNWTEVNDLNTGRYYLAGCGASNTASLAFGGHDPGGRSDKTETWNGTNWTEVNNLNKGIDQLGGTGTSTAALAIGGDVNPNDKTLLWNGTNWTEVNDLNTGRKNAGAAGITTSALASGGGGTPSIVANTETWNGTNWTEVGDLNAAISKAAGAGTTAAGLSFGGNNPPDVTTAATEEFTSGPTTSTLGSE